MVPGPRLISLSHRDHPRERAIRIPMAAPASIPFPVALAPLAPADDLALLTPAERGIWLALMDIAWDSGCRVPNDLTHLAARLRCGVSDLERLMATLAGCVVISPACIQFPRLHALREELTARAARVSELQRARRLGRSQAPRSLRLADDDSRGESPPGRAGPDLRATGGQLAVNRRSTAGRRDAICAFRSSLSAQRSNQESADQSALRAEQSTSGRAPGAEETGVVGVTEFGVFPARSEVERAIVARSIDPMSLPAMEGLAELSRRRDVFAVLHRAVFVGACQGQERIPERTARVTSLAPWVTPKMAAGHVWTAKRLVAEAASRKEAFNPIGFVVRACGTAARSIGTPEETDVLFEPVWARKQAEAARSMPRPTAISSNSGSGVSHA